MRFIRTRSTLLPASKSTTMQPRSAMPGRMASMWREIGHRRSESTIRSEFTLPASAGSMNAIHEDPDETCRFMLESSRSFNHHRRRRFPEKPPPRNDRFRGLLPRFWTTLLALLYCIHLHRSSNTRGISHRDALFCSHGIFLSGHCEFDWTKGNPIARGATRT